MMTASLHDLVGQILLETDDRLGFTAEQLDVIHQVCATAWRDGFNRALDAARHSMDNARVDVDNVGDCPLCLQHRP